MGIIILSTGRSIQQMEGKDMIGENEKNIENEENEEPEIRYPRRFWKTDILPGERALDRSLTRRAMALFLAVLLVNLFTRFMADWYPLDDDSSSYVLNFQKFSYFLQWVNPYLLAALGASIFLLRQVQYYIQKNEFNIAYIPSYRISFWIGVFAGGTAVLVFFEEISATADGRITLSEAMVGFIFGYASDVFFRWLDVTIGLFRPNIKAVEGHESSVTEQISSADGTSAADGSSATAQTSATEQELNKTNDEEVEKP